MKHHSRWLAVALVGALSLNLFLLPAGAAQSPLTILTPSLDLSRYERPPVEVKLRVAGEARGLRVTLNGAEVTQLFRPLGGGVLRASFSSEQLKHGVNRLEVRLGEHLATRTFRVRSLLGAMPGPPPSSNQSGPLYVPIQTRVISGDGSQVSDYAIKVGDTLYPAQPTPDGSTAGFQFLVLDRGTLEVVDQFSLSTDFPNNLYYAAPGCGEYGCLWVVQSLQYMGIAPPKPLASIIAEVGGFQYANLVQNISGFDPEYGYSLISNVGANSSFGQVHERLTCAGSGDCGSITVAGDKGAISGALILDNNQAYTFADPGRATFATGTGTSSTSNTMTINGQATASATISSGSGAFQLVRVYRDTLTVASQQTFNFDQLYNGSDPNAETMERELRLAEQYPFYLVFISSIGDLGHAGYEDEWASVGQALAQLGGTYSLFLQLASGDDYSFVGAGDTTFGNGAVEASSIVSAATQPAGAQTPPSNLRGVLAKDNYGNYRPTISRLTSTDTTNETTLEDFTLAQLDAIALQSPTVWPVVNSSDPTAANYCDPNKSQSGDAGTCLAYRDISKQLTKGNPDLRSLYNDNVSVSGWDFSSVTQGTGYTTDDYNSVLSQLETEVGYVKDVAALAGDINILNTDQQTQLNSILNQAYQAVSDSLSPDSGSSINPKWQAFFAIAETLTGDVGSIAGGPPAKAALDMTFGVYNFGAAAANNTNGQALQSLQVTFGNLESAATDAFENNLVIVGNLFNLIYEDWGRLQALGQPLASGSGIKWDPSLNGVLLKGLDRAVRRHYFTQLIGSSFQMGHWTNIGEGAPPDIGVLCNQYTSYTVEVCTGGNCYGVVKCDTPGSDDENWVALPSSLAPGQGGDDQNYDIWLIGTDVSCSANKNGGLLGPLFAPLDPNDSTKLGIYKPYFFLYTPINAYTNPSCNR